MQSDCSDKPERRCRKDDHSSQSGCWSGKVFSAVAGDKGLYQPIFAVSGLESAVHEITAAEDIVTTDGTVRAEKGAVVDTVTTGADGTAKSKELYLGRYEVKEVTAPYGMVLNEEVHSGELVYAGQEQDRKLK